VSRLNFRVAKPIDIGESKGEIEAALPEDLVWTLDWGANTGGPMPYWSILCLYCSGYIADALLECVPAARRSHSAYNLLFQRKPGAAFACPYCNQLLDFDEAGEPQAAESGMPVFRYGRRELELKKEADGEPPEVTLPEWALRHRFTEPGSHLPLEEYLYAEQAPPNETVP
jgi:hypothetical protein